MKCTVKIVLLFFIFTQCSPDPKKNDCDANNFGSCQTPDSRLYGNWKLVEECACYTFGGDLKWKKVSKNLIFSFNDQCIIKALGDTDTDCNTGRYSISQNHIDVTWICSNCSTSKNVYEYNFNPKGDTLLFKGFVDEGYIGSKYYLSKKDF